METATASSVRRISVGRRLFSWTALGLLYICFLAAVFFSTAAIVRLEWPWWFGTFLAILSIWAIIWRELHRETDCDGTTYIVLDDGAVTYMPSRKMRSQGLPTAKAAFPVGSALECRMANGDRYLTSDHGQKLLTSLWIIWPDGTRHSLLSDVIDLNLKTATSNLRRSGVPFRVIKVYDGQEGEHTETDVTARYVQVSNGSRTPRFRFC